jgi:hypothetical protein
VNKNSPYVILSEQICLVEIFVIPFIVEIFVIPFIVEIFVERFSDINQKNLAGMNFGGNFMAGQFLCSKTSVFFWVTPLP